MGGGPAGESSAPEISIIVLGWNGLRFVDECLDSLRDQDIERPYEIIFVDNGSRDGTPDRAAAHDAVIVHRLDRNYGYCIGNNKGAALARGRYIVFLNQDVVAHRSWLRELVAALESDDAIAAAHANIIQPWYDEFAGMERVAAVPAAHTADLSRLGYIHYRTLERPAAAVDTLFLHGVSIILRRSALDELGYAFDPDMFAYAEDMDLALRLRVRGYRTVTATRAAIYHKHELASSLSIGTARKTVRIIRNRLLALWKSSTWPEFLPLAVITVAGAPFNAGEFGLSPAKRALYFVALIPASIMSVFATAIAMPRFAGRRRDELRARRVAPWWLVRTMLFGRGHLASQARPARSADGSNP